MPRYDIHEVMRLMSYDDRLTALVCSVISTRRDAISSAIYMVESASVMSIALSGREKTRLASKMRDTADELERQVMVGG
jgi:hypothetical protein